MTYLGQAGAQHAAAPSRPAVAATRGIPHGSNRFNADEQHPSLVLRRFAHEASEVRMMVAEPPRSWRLTMGESRERPQHRIAGHRGPAAAIGPGEDFRDALIRRPSALDEPILLDCSGHAGNGRRVLLFR
jgi:hypothetical protein